MGGFYQLHEKVNLKEMSSESLTMEGTGLGTQPTRTSQQVSQIIGDDLEHFRDMPSSHKWTWGEVLTKQDILGLQHMSKQQEPTGYDTSLLLGLLPGEYSATHTTPSTSAHFSIIPPDPQLPPLPHLYSTLQTWDHTGLMQVQILLTPYQHMMDQWMR